MNLIEKKIREKLFNRLNESDDPSKTGWSITRLGDANLRAASANNFATANLAERSMVIKFKNTKIKSLDAARSSAVGIGSVEMNPKQAYRHLDFKLTDPAFITDLNSIISESPLITAQARYKSGDYLFVWTCTRNTKYRKTFVVWIVYTRRIKLIIENAKKLKLIDNSSKDTTTVNVGQFIANKIQLIDVDTAIDWSDTLKSKIKTNAKLLDEFENNMPKFHKLKQAKVDDAEDDAEEDAKIIKKSSKIKAKVDIINNQNTYWLPEEYIGEYPKMEILYSTYDLVKKQKNEVFKYKGTADIPELAKITSNLLLIAPVSSINFEVTVIPKSSMWTKTETHVIYKHDDLGTYDDVDRIKKSCNSTVPGQWSVPDITMFDSLAKLKGLNKTLNLNKNTISADPTIKTSRASIGSAAAASLLGMYYEPVTYPIGNDIKISSPTPWAFIGTGDVKTTIDLKKQIINMKQGRIVLKPSGQTNITYLFEGKFKNNKPDWTDPACKLTLYYTSVGTGRKLKDPIMLTDYAGSFEIDNFKLLTGTYDAGTNNNTGDVILKTATVANYEFTPPELSNTVVRWTYSGTYYNQYNKYLSFKDGKISSNDKGFKSDFIQIAAGKFVKPDSTTEEAFNNDLRYLGLLNVVVNTKEIVKINPPWIFAGGTGTPWPNNITAPTTFTPLKFKDNKFQTIYKDPLALEKWAKYYPNYYGSAVNSNNEVVANDAAPLTEFYIKTSTFIDPDKTAGIQQYIKFTRDTTNINEFKIF